MGKEVFKIFDVLSKEAREDCLKDMSKYQRNIFYELESDEEKAKNYKLKDLIYDFDKEFVEKKIRIRSRGIFKRT